MLDNNLDAGDLERLGMLPRFVPWDAIQPACCLECRALVWIEGDDGPDLGPRTLDLEEFRGIKLLSLHPCAHELGAEDFDDPDWGWVGEGQADWCDRQW